MIKFISKRVVQIIILLFIYVTIVYWLMEAMPGSFIDKYIMNPKITPEAREAIKKQFGYDKPAFQRFLLYMKNFLRGDLGTSFTFYPRKVIDIIKERLPRTIFLFVTATLISYMVGFNLGKRIAWNRGKISDKVATFVGIVFWTIFTPILAIFNIWLFAIILKGNLNARGIFLFILTAVFSYMAGHSRANKLVNSKKRTSTAVALTISVLWIVLFFVLIFGVKNHLTNFFVGVILLPAVVFYLIGYMVGARVEKKLFRIYGKRFEKEGRTETALWTIVIPGLMFLVMAALYVILGNIPLNQFIDPELWRSAPFSSQYVFTRLLWSGFVLIIALMIAFILSSKMKTVMAKRLSFWSVMIASFVFLAFWWSFASYTAENGVTFHLGMYAVDIIRHMILPILTLTVLSFAGSMLVMRDTMLEIIKEDYITTAKAKGLPDHVVRDKHAARNALLPLITNFVISLGFTVSGGIITETMFSWPGMGLAYLQALNEQDIPLLIGLLVFTGIFVLVAHLIADILYAFLDPRIRY